MIFISPILYWVNLGMKQKKIGKVFTILQERFQAVCLTNRLAPPTFKFGKTHNLVISLLERYTEKGYIVYMDNYNSSPYLFYNLLSKNTAACSTIHIPRKGIPKDIYTAKLKKQGKNCIMTYSDKLVATKLLDCQHVTFYLLLLIVP